jgi:hypothetical protein
MVFCTAVGLEQHKIERAFAVSMVAKEGLLFPRVQRMIEKGGRFPQAVYPAYHAKTH